MAETATLDISPWLDRVTKSKTRKELYEVLEEFRPLNWTDEQRSTIAKLYMRIIADLPSGETGIAGGG